LSAATASSSPRATTNGKLMENTNSPAHHAEDRRALRDGATRRASRPSSTRPKRTRSTLPSSRRSRGRQLHRRRDARHSSPQTARKNGYRPLQPARNSYRHLPPNC
jgi:hypothetical protein